MAPFLATLSLFITAVSSLDYVFAFGDSYTTVGFSISGEQPSTTNPIGNPPYPGFTSCGGINYIEFAAVNRTNTLLYDFAYGGAPVDNTLTPRNPPDNTIVDFVHQVQELTNNATLAPGNADSNTFFTAFFGINDILNIFNETPDNIMLDPRIFETYRDQLSDLYAIGARRFVLLTVPPISETPVIKELPANVAPVIADGVTSWNQQLSDLAATFRAAHPDVTLQVYDTQPVWDRILADPTAFGAPNNTCTNTDGTSCLFWDVLHPAVAIQVSWGLDIVKLLNP